MGTVEVAARTLTIPEVSEAERSLLGRILGRFPDTLLFLRVKILDARRSTNKSTLRRQRAPEANTFVEEVVLRTTAAARLLFLLADAVHQNRHQLVDRLRVISKISDTRKKRILTVPTRVSKPLPTQTEFVFYSISRLGIAKGPSVKTMSSLN